MENNMQNPLLTGYHHFSTPADVLTDVDLHGKNAVVTGGYTGIGLWTTKALVSAGAHVTVLARDIKRAQHNLKKIPNTEIIYFDLLKPETIDLAAKTIVDSNRPLHFLINSAGIIGIPLTRDHRGYEYQFATNHLGHFQLTARLYPALKKAHGARVISVTSRGHRWGGVLFDDPNFEKTVYSANRAYAASKSALSLFMVHLDTLAKKDNIRAFAVHPGPIPSSDLFAESIVGIKPNYQVALTRLSAKLMRGLHLTELLNIIRKPQTGDAFKTIQQGATTSVWCATSAELAAIGGVYCEDADIAEIVSEDSQAPYGVRPWAIDPQLAERCWLLSEKMTGIKFTI
ncbi:NAD(P)-dependent dehydrogenase (short-subunit alcohol dehydrogenase family) [Enterococcus sp. PF1-24]|uniref:SDR family NAD(P)-dependent oxidoreductase n=1 Tax=unclassified Enterococcus TaxID=2608891 RepID=UPI0024747FED|nr:MULTISPECIES: SDR family NAD(P)-dependent oxidoreductase [unclassified Enterococcus]MDH6365840.1 NAD(P)-dependent dehydrogenase (short-subunit alcohol dehydrogenase family) [Enterococcus sp. PFB1-1]MDH6402932.1 NAD(P)-dependent dehydrogenase (short-subunit alcohol dehydrogenase family) [Enterococcus sp. PF1-24]